jgi:RNA polymerase sigma-70 factor, ECF subfamily
MMPLTPEHVPAGTTWSAAARGDDEALTALVRAYHDRVYRFGRRVCRDAFDADDAVQEAFVALARRQDVVGEPGALFWLMTVVRNACRRMLRPFARQRRALGVQLSIASPAEEPPTDALDPQQTLERWEVVNAVHGALAALPRAYREVLVLRDLEGLTGAETCAALGLDPTAMKSRLHRARASLRAMLVRIDDRRIGGSVTDG